MYIAPVIRFGILGAGDVAQHTYIPGVARQSAEGKLELVALCDQLPGRAETLAAQYGIPRHYTSYEQMLAEAAIDAVVNLTPPTFHVEAILQAFFFNDTATTEK